jgi:hypothetical protein
MRLVNTTAAAVDVALTTVDGAPTQKAAIVTAKLTFRVTATGVHVVTEDPMPIFDDDVETPLGILPRDTGGFAHSGVEVLVNGAAYSPHGFAVSSVDLSLVVGGVERRAVANGDRMWVGWGPDAVPSEPLPFLRMPATYERAFGGTADVWLDEHTMVPMSHPGNPRGRGFDPSPDAAELAAELGVPAGYPRFDMQRWLPNLEDPSARVTAWADAPRPHCWSARPITALGGYDAKEPDAVGQDWLLARCHPDLLLQGDLRNTRVYLRGMGRVALDFLFPPIDVAIDYHLGDREGARRLELRRLMLLPEEERFVCTYETRFRFEAPVGGERSLRLRFELPE